MASVMYLIIFFCYGKYSLTNLFINKPRTKQADATPRGQYKGKKRKKKKTQIDY